MSKVFILIYVAVVLGIAGFARADVPMKSLPIDSESVVFNQSDYALYVRGELAVGCDKFPRPVFSQEDDNTVKMQVMVEALEVCAQQNTGNYDLVFDLRSQLEMAEVEVNKDTVIKIAGTGQQLELDGYEFDGAFPFFNEIFEGHLIEVNGGFKFWTTGEDGSRVLYNVKVTEPMSHDSLKAYINQPVAVTGYVFEYTVPGISINGPGYTGEEQSTIWISSISSSEIEE